MPLAISSGVPMRSSSPDFGLGAVLPGVAAAALLMLKHFGDNAQSAARAGNLETKGDRAGAATWRRITDAVEQLANPMPAGPNRLYAWSGPPLRRRRVD